MANSRRNKLPAAIKLLIVISVMLVVISSAYYINIIHKSFEPQYIITPEPTETNITTPKAPAYETAEIQPVEQKPVIKEPLQEILDLREEYSNEDIIGYLEIDGTNISYPVAQSNDNELYLDHDLYGKDSAYGAIFLDYENSIDEFSDNSVIYGHNMKDGSMFHNMRYYFDKEYYDKHPYISFTTLYDKTIWEIFSFYKTTTDFYYIQTNFDDVNDFYGLVMQMKIKSVYDTGVNVSKNDKIITLSTCANEGGDNRYVLNAKLITE